MRTIHLAGVCFCVDGRYIQRCGICGEKLHDSTTHTTPIPPGIFVEQYECGEWRHHHTMCEGPSPEGFCIDLVEY